jgi:hypothetical protein
VDSDGSGGASVMAVDQRKGVGGRRHGAEEGGWPGVAPGGEEVGGGAARRSGGAVDRQWPEAGMCEQHGAVMPRG